MNDYDLVILFCGILSYFSAVCHVIATVGDAIVFHVFWRVASLLAPIAMESTPYGKNHLLGVTLILSIRAIAVEVVTCYRNRETACWPLLSITVPISLVMMSVGSIILDRFHDEWWLGAVIGIFFGLFAFVFMIAYNFVVLARRAKGIRDVVDPKKFVITPVLRWSMGVATAVSGFLTGVTGIGALPIVFVGILFGIPPFLLRNTLPFIAFADFLFRFLGSLSLGRYDPDAWMLYVAAAFGAGCGVPLGVEFGRGLPQDTFVLCACWLSIFAGLTISGMPGYALVIALLIAFFSFAVITTMGWPANKKKSALQAAAAPKPVVESDDYEDEKEMDERPASQPEGDAAPPGAVVVLVPVVQGVEISTQTE